jgi:hypothetical protein
MKKILLAFALIAGVTVAANAQDSKVKTKTDGGGQTVKMKEKGAVASDQDPRLIAEHISRDMRDKLGLTSAQQQQLMEVNLLVAKRQISMSELNEKDREGVNSEIENYQNSQYREILSKEQYEQWEKMKVSK